MYMVLKMLHYR